MLVSPVVNLNIIKDDPADDKFLECAVTADADYIVSGDKHLKNLKLFQGIKIIWAPEFIEIFVSNMDF